jgi:hypothetical protein
MCLNAGGQRRLDAESETLIPTIGGGFDGPVGITLHGTDGTASVASLTDLSSSLRARIPSGVENSTTTAVMQPVAFRETADCLTAAYGTKWNGNASADNGSLFAFHPTQDPISSSDVCHAIGTGNGQGCATAAVFVQDDTTPKVGDDLANCLRRDAGGEGACVLPPVSMQVRRLTPVECERLQGFPDGYTAIPWRKKPASECSDGPRYKALGNSWAVPVVRWIGRRIAAATSSRPSSSQTS